MLGSIYWPGGSHQWWISCVRTGSEYLCRRLYYVFCKFWSGQIWTPTMTNLTESVSGMCTCIVGLWQIPSWSFPARPHCPTGPVASDWPRRTEKKGRHLMLAQTCSSSIRPNVTECVHLFLQQKSQFLMHRRLCMNIEREHVKENEQHRKHLKRTAR